MVSGLLFHAVRPSCTLDRWLTALQCTPQCIAIGATRTAEMLEECKKRLGINQSSGHCEEPLNSRGEANLFGVWSCNATNVSMQDLVPKVGSDPVTASGRI